MKIKSVLKEAVYPGNIGAIEVFQFYKTATSDQKEEFDYYLDSGDYDNAWELIQQVTDTDLDKPH